MALARGVVLASRYRIQKVVGRGTTGTVYRAHDVLLDQPVAIKVLSEEAAARQGSARSFRNEVGLSRRVSHPNVCRVHEYVEDAGARFLVRDLVDGRDLRALVRGRGPLEAERACDIALEVARGLGAIHAAGLVHRRLTARHVLCDPSPRVRIAGLRRARRPGAARPSYRRAGGPAEYMSPEEAQGRAVDARSDLYSLGVLLFEMLTGEPPFRASTPVLTRLQQIHEPPPLSGPRAARVPLRLVSFLQKALAKSPDERYGSAEEMAGALRIASRPVVPMEAGVLPWAIHEELLDDPFERPRPSRALVGLLAATAATAAVAGASWLIGRSPPSPAPGASAAVTRPATPFVPAAIESPPPLPIETMSPDPPPASVEAAVSKRLSRPVRAVRHEPPPPARLSEETIAPAVMETSHLLEEPVAPETAEPSPADETPGRLQIGVRPWAVVRIDDRPFGETPLAPLELAPGVHTARLEHPDYQPFVRKVTVRPGETVRLQVDLGQEGVAR